MERSGGAFTVKGMPLQITGSHRQKLFIVLVYIVMIAGGIWHALGMFEKIRALLATPLLIFLTGLLVFETLHQYIKQKDPVQTRKMIIWCLGIFFPGLIVEWLGVKSGKIFGHYQYGQILQPQLDAVPIAIGFAWLLSVIGAVGCAQQILGDRYYQKKARFLTASVLMLVLFDFFMEPAAIELGYWSWLEGTIPLQNYFAWFFIGGILVLCGDRLGLFQKRYSPLACHFYIAQVLYFGLIWLF